MVKDPSEIKNIHAERVVILSGDQDPVNPPSYLAKDKKLGHTSAPVGLYEEALEILGD